MPWCCEEFEKRIADSGEGIRLGQTLWLLPHEIRSFYLYYQEKEPESAKALRINFCPWCGTDLKTLPKPQPPSDENFD